jgi:hypothetical protein
LGVYILENIQFPLLDGKRLDYPFMWKLCGPTHDLGYPIEIANNIENYFTDEVNKIIEELDSPSPKIGLGPYPRNLDKLCGNGNANHIIQMRLDDWGLKLSIHDYYEWLGKKNKIDHGVISALAQLKVIEALYYKANQNREYREIYYDGLNFDQTIFDKDIVTVSSALFLHNIDLNYPGFIERISFNIAPLAFLLFLCDTFQEWDRYSESKDVYSGTDFDIICNTESIFLFVPQKLANKVSKALSTRLTGFSVFVNNKKVVQT